MTQEQTNVIIPEVEKAIEEWFDQNWAAYIKSQERDGNIPF